MMDVLLRHIFLSPAQRRVLAGGFPVLVYHGVGSPPQGARDPFLFTAPAQFDAQLAALRAAGFTSASLDAFGKSDAPKTGIAVTLDDACRNVAENALGPLARHGFRAIEFVVSGLIGGQNAWDVKHGDAPVPLMDAGQLREWLAAGHEIGSHTVTHRNLTHCDEAAAREEIFASKHRLEDLFGRPVRHFCYPHGRWNERVRALVGEAGYATACTTAFGSNVPGCDPLTLRRIVPLSARELAGKALHRLRRKMVSLRSR